MQSPLDEIKPSQLRKKMSLKEKFYMMGIGILAIGLPLLSGKPVDPEEAKKPKLQNGCSVAGILALIKEPHIKLAEDGTLIEIRGSFNTAPILAKNPACRVHLENADRNPELVVTFKNRPALPPVFAPAQP